MPVGVEFGLLGPVAARDADGSPLALGAPRHREVLGRLLIARGRVVPVGRLVADLWEDEAPGGAVGAVRTFVAALRRSLEPDRPARRPSRLLVTDGPGYALRADRGAVDAWRFEDTVARAAAAPPYAAVALWEEALALWRGPVLADFPRARWAAAEQARLEALRLDAVERRADAQLATGAARDAVADLRAHVVAHPGREDGWVLLATALDRAGQRGEALETLRRARAALAGTSDDHGGHGGHGEDGAHGNDGAHGSDGGHGAHGGDGRGHLPGDGRGHLPGDGRGHLPGDALVRAEARLLGAGSGTSAGSRPATEPPGIAGSVWDRAAASWDRAVPARSRARLHATAGLLRDLAVTGADGLEEAHRHRRDLVAAAETTGDSELAARIIGSYDVPAVWTRADDPDGAGELVRAAARAAARLDPAGQSALRARLLSVVAVESRGDAAADVPPPRAVDAPVVEAWRQRAGRAADEAVRLARRLGDPALLAFALNGSFMQSYAHCGSAARRNELGLAITELAVAHQLPGHEVLGRIVRLQALAGLGDLTAADAEAERIDCLAHRNERPLATVFTSWYRVLRTCETDGWAAARPLYARVLADSADCGMPGLARGAAVLVALVPVMRGDVPPDPGALARLDAGPYRPWLDPLLLAASGAADQARRALATVPRPPHDLLQEALWCVLARAAQLVGHRPVLRRAHDELLPARGELAGAGSGLVSFGSIAHHLEAVDAALVEAPSPQVGEGVEVDDSGA